jgi:uncharacterized membrane protein YhaH (DUF805 family)
MMKCSACGTDNLEVAQFCASCGVSFSEGTTGVRTRSGMVSFPEAVTLGFKRYLVFTGRSARAEFWWWTLFVAVVALVFSLISPPIQWAFEIATLMPGISLGVRRLHDVNRSGWWMLLSLGFMFFIPIIILLIMAAVPGNKGANKYGPEPWTTAS